jgi:sister-chromatid-cohesion protein PDS5
LNVWLRHQRRSEDESGAEGNVAPSSGPRRKSGRQSIAHKSYIEVSSDEEDTAAGAEQEKVDTSEDDGSSSPAPEEDVEMADEDKDEAEDGVEEEEAEENAEASEQSEQEASPEPEPEPPKKSTRGRPAKKANGISTTPATQKRKAAESVKEVTSAKKAVKGKVNGTAGTTSSSPVTNGVGSVRRSGRSRA